MRIIRAVLAVLLLVGVVVALPAQAASAAGELDDLSWTVVEIEVNGVAFDPVSGLLLATVGGSDLNYGNELVAFDPQTLELAWSVPVGSEPNQLEVSNDGSTVYVGLDGSYSLARVDTASQSVTDTIVLPLDSSHGALQAEDIAIAPGNPDLVAVATKRPGVSPRHGGVAIYDNGSLLPDMTPGHTGSNSIDFGATSSILYGQNTETTEFGFRRMTVSDTGVSIDDVTGDFAGGSFHNTMVYVDGLVYFRHGAVADPTVPRSIGTYTADRWIEGHAPLPSLGMTMTISGTSIGGVDVLSIFDIDGFNLIDETTIDHGMSYGTYGAVAIDGKGIAAPYDEGLLIAGFFPGGTLRGLLTDSLTGDSISEVCVYATDDETYIMGETETLEDGTYTMRVPPGTWNVLFADCNYSDFFWEWHKDQPFFRLSYATPVTVVDGQTVTVDATMERRFEDARDTVFETDIWWMRDTGITSGCRAESYCPNQTVTRGQMAAFLVRALRLSSTSDVDFTDDNGHIFELDIEKLATAGITKGCNPPVSDRFCPDRPVTRGQMAAFLVRALDLTATSGVDFVDDNGHIFEADIEKLATAGITTGCNPPANDSFCPDQVVTRGQMAAFLHRALEDEFVLGLPASTGPRRVPQPWPAAGSRDLNH